MKWASPIDYKLIPTTDSYSFKYMKPGTTGLPLPSHLGAFGVKRRHHSHEGIDLYCDDGSYVKSVNNGIVLNIVSFTGASMDSPWWEDTMAVLVHTKDGIVVYGEITPATYLKKGQEIKQGDFIGNVKKVLKEDKGRPMSMLHLELHKCNIKYHAHCIHPLVEWLPNDPQPENLLDPTSFLLEAL